MKRISALLLVGLAGFLFSACMVPPTVVVRADAPKAGEETKRFVRGPDNIIRENVLATTVSNPSTRVYITFFFSEYPQKKYRLRAEESTAVEVPGMGSHAIIFQAWFAGPKGWEDWGQCKKSFRFPLSEIVISESDFPGSRRK